MDRVLKKDAVFSRMIAGSRLSGACNLFYRKGLCMILSVRYLFLYFLAVDVQVLHGNVTYVFDMVPILCNVIEVGVFYRNV